MFFTQIKTNFMSKAILCVSFIKQMYLTFITIIDKIIFLYSFLIKQLPIVHVLMIYYYFNYNFTKIIF